MPPGCRVKVCVNLISSTSGGYFLCFFEPYPWIQELNTLLAAAWRGHSSLDFGSILNRSLAFICTYHPARLIGFVNLAWDGRVNAFVLDTTVRPAYQRRGTGRQLVQQATAVAKERGIEWLHVDLEPHLQVFYDECGFQSTKAELMNLMGDDAG